MTHSLILRRKMYSSIAYIVYFTLCISGLTWQVYELSSSYFKFGIATRIQLEYSGEFILVLLSLYIRHIVETT